MAAEQNLFPSLMLKLMVLAVTDDTPSFAKVTCHCGGTDRNLSLTHYFTSRCVLRPVRLLRLYTSIKCLKKHSSWTAGDALLCVSLVAEKLEKLKSCFSFYLSTGWGRLTTVAHSLDDCFTVSVTLTRCYTSALAAPPFPRVKHTNTPPPRSDLITLRLSQCFLHVQTFSLGGRNMTFVGLHACTHGYG